MYRKKMSSDLTQGQLGPMIIRFALPLALMGMLQQMFNATDVAIVGQFAGKEAMAAVGSNSSIVGLMINLFVGFATGVNVIVAQSTGEKDIKQIGKEVHTSILFAAVGGILFMIVGELIAEPLLILTCVPDEIFDMALLYLRIYMIGLPFIFLYNFEASIFRSQGNTRTPLICLSIAGVLNVLLNLFLVIVMHWSVMGVASATVFSNLVSSLIMFILLVRTDGPVKVRWSCFRVDKRSLKGVVKIGLPAGIQMTVFSLSGIVVQSAVNQLGADVIAATSAAFYIEVVYHYIISAFGQTTMTFVGQNYGARNMDRCKETLKISMIQCQIITIVCIFLGLFFGRQLLTLFNTDPNVINLGYYRLFFSIPASVIHAFNENFTGALRGYGDSLTPAIIYLVGSCAIRVAWVYTVFALNKTFFTILIVHPISWAVTAIAVAIYYFHKVKKIRSAVQ